MKHSSFLTIASLAFVSLPFLTSCQDEDFGYTSEQISYRTNFDKMFGKASNIPTFDLSTYNLNKMGLQGGPSAIYGTRATGDIFEVVHANNDGFYVPQMLQNWLDENLKEGVDNTKKGTTQFKFLMPDHEILIIPVYQGQAGMVWNLMLSESNDFTKSDTNAKLVWEKSNLIEVKSQANGVTTYSTSQAKTQTFTLSGSDFKPRQDYGNGGNNNDLVYNLNNYLNQMGFDRNNEWIRVEVSGLANSGNGTIRCAPGNTSDVCIGKVDYSNGSVTYNVQNEKVLSSSNIELVEWYPHNTYNSNLTVKITIFKKNTNSDAWKGVNTINSKSVNGSTVTGENAHNTIGEIVRTQAIKISPEQVPSGVFSLYLDIQNLEENCWSGATWKQHYANRTDMWSTNKQMVALTALQDDPVIGQDIIYQLKQAYGEDREYENIALLGCEDSNKNDDTCSPKHGSDWDVNDIVFLIIGMKPQNIIPANDVVIKKRYMIEDLGSTFDFDFNDMVVDVTQVKHTENSTTTVKNYATLKHLCGTIPFQIKIGDKTFGPYAGNNGGSEQGGEGYNPANDNSYRDFMNAEFTGWNPETNNITVTSWPESAGMSADALENAKKYVDSGDNATDKYLGILGKGKTFSFPETGEYPYIIACDQTVQWMKELITIPTSWFTVSPKNDHPVYGDGDTPSQGGGQQGGGDQGGDTTPNTSLNNGPVTIASKSDGNYNQAYYTFDDNTANSLQAGDVLVITADKNNFQLVFNNDWDNIYNVQSKGNNTYELTLTADQVTAIKANHTITFNGGNNVTISALTVRKGTSDDGGNTPIQWTGSQQYTDNNWGSSLQNLPKANFGTELGDYSGDVTVTLTAANNANVGKFKVSNTNDGNSGWDGKLSNNNDGISFTNGTCSFDVSSSNLYLLKSGQIVFQTDCAFTLTSFKIEKKN